MTLHKWIVFIFVPNVSRIVGRQEQKVSK